MSVGANQRTKVAYGVVRDAQGNVKVDDPDKLDPGLVMLLSPQDRAHVSAQFNLPPDHALNHQGGIVRDAQGVKKVNFVRNVPNGKDNMDVLFAVPESLVAASTVYFRGKLFTLAQRVDVAAGGNLTLTVPKGAAP